ncbi:MAG: O-antigen ligase family protein, partial [bacterium]|nr:O-antigen ligase family protein [bacterium]
MSKNILKQCVYVGLFLIPFIPFLVSGSLFFPFITTKAFAFRILIEIIFSAWLVLAVLDAAYRPKRTLILYTLGGFLLIILLANIFGEAPVKSFWSNYERMEGYITLLHLGAFFLVIGSVFREIDWKRWWNTSLAASALMVIYSLFQLAGAFRINQGGVRVDGTFGNATYLAVYMLFHIFIVTLFLWRERKNAVARWLYAILILGQLYILYATATRGAILGLLGGLFIFALLNLSRKAGKGIRKASVATLAGLIVLVGGFFLIKNTSFIQKNPVLERFANISGTELKGGGRAFVWPMALEGIKKRPILGWGQENFNYVFNENYKAEMFRLEPWFDRAHNIFLDWGIAGGLLGLLSYLSLYGAFIYIVWKKSDMPHAEKSILTGLLAAYFFHNFFVFDHLISYVLFFSLLAYIHSKSQGELLAARDKRAQSQQMVLPLVSSGVAVALVFVLYFVNIRPLSANTSLINALKSLQGGQQELAAGMFKRAYERSRLGRPEAVEQIATNGVTVLSGDMSVEAKNNFFHFARQALTGQVQSLPGDARYQVMAGSFLWRTGQFDEAQKYLDRAIELMPNKQFMYFERGSMFLNRGENQKALADFKT